VIEDWRSLYNEGRHNVFASPVVIKVIKSGLMWQTGHIESMWN